MMHEFENDHLPELKKVISETNQAYRAYAAEQQRIQSEGVAQERQQKEELSNLNKRLKFD